MTTEKTEKAGMAVSDMVMIALSAAVTCILAPLSIPIGPVPISLTNLVIYVSLYVLGWKRGTAAYCLYLLIGFIGVPVFSGFTGGIGKLAGPTGGYLTGFIFMAVLCGLFIKKFYRRRIVCMLGMILGTVAAYAFGTVWFCYSTGTGLWAALGFCVFPFVPGDIGKIVLAAFTGPALAGRIRKGQGGL